MAAHMPLLLPGLRMTRRWSSCKAAQRHRPSPMASGVQESEACAALVPSSQLVLVEGADHNFTSPEAGREMARRVVDFVLG